MREGPEGDRLPVAVAGGAVVSTTESSEVRSMSAQLRRPTALFGRQSENYYDAQINPIAEGGQVPWRDTLDIC